MKKLFSIAMMALTLAACGNQSEESASTSGVVSSVPSVDEQAIRDSIEAATRDSIEKAEAAKAQAAAAEAAKIEKDVNEWVATVQDAMNNGIMAASGQAMQIQNSALAGRIAQYKNAGKLTPAQRQRVDAIDNAWINFDPRF